MADDPQLSGSAEERARARDVFDHALKEFSKKQKSPFADVGYENPVGSYAKDISLSALSGIPHGVSGVIGAPAWLPSAAQYGGEWLQSKITGKPIEEVQKSRESAMVVPRKTAEDLNTAYGPEAWYRAQPLQHKPETTPGEYAHTITSFISGGGLTGGIRSLKDLAKWAVTPAVVTETAGQAARRLPGFEDYEGPIRALAALGTGAGVATRDWLKRTGVTGGPGATITSAASGKVTPAQLDEAEALFKYSNTPKEEGGLGIPMSRAQAVQHVTGGATNLGAVQRYVEGTGEMRPFYAGTGPAVREAAQGKFDELGMGFGLPRSRENPMEIGPQVASTAQHYIENQTPQGKQLNEAVFQSGPRVTPEQAGNVIQPELAAVEARREGMRSALADKEFAAAREAPAEIPMGGDYRVGGMTEHYAIPEPPPVGRGAAGRFERKGEQQLAVERLEQPAPVGRMKRDPNTGQMVRKSEDEYAAEVAANEAEMMRAREARMAQLNVRRENVPIVGEAPTHYVQVDPSPVAAQLDNIIATTARGPTAAYLERARKLLNHPSTGELDTTVAGLQSARQEIGNIIGEANSAGHGFAAEQLKHAQIALDRALERVKAQAEAVQGYQAASRPLDPFRPDRVPGQITERVPGIGRRFPESPDDTVAPFAMPAERVPGAIEGKGAQGVREFQQVAGPRSGEAFENHLVTQVLDKAGRQGIDINSKAIRQAILENEDLLRQVPGVRDKLELVASRREGLERVMASPIGKLAGKPDVDHALSVLFERNPTQTTPENIAAAIEGLKKSSPKLAQDVVGHYLQTTFDQYTRGLTGGANQYGGPGFAAAVRGNAQQADNLTAAIGSAFGPKIADGYNKWLDALQALGTRERPGSATTFNQELREVFERGGLAGDVAVNAAFTGAGTALGGPAGGVFAALRTLPDRAKQAMQRLNRVSNAKEISALLTNPAMGEEFKRLATAPVGSKNFANTLSRLAIMADIAANRRESREE